MLNSLLFLALLLAACGYAVLRGGAPERICGVIFFGGAVGTLLVVSAPARRFASVELGILVLDCAMLLALVVLALLAQRFWLIWATALHSIGTAGHAVRLADPELIPWGYAFALAFWSYPMLALLAVGTYCHQRRLARHGVDRSWSSSFPRSDLKRPTGRTG